MATGYIVGVPSNGIIDGNESVGTFLGGIVGTGLAQNTFNSVATLGPANLQSLGSILVGTTPGTLQVGDDGNTYFVPTNPNALTNLLGSLVLPSIAPMAPIQAPVPGAIFGTAGDDATLAGGLARTSFMVGRLTRILKLAPATIRLLRTRVTIPSLLETATTSCSAAQA